MHDEPAVPIQIELPESMVAWLRKMSFVKRNECVSTALLCQFLLPPIKPKTGELQ